ncbi:DUF7370 family protein [Xenorhabdus griffiniae]|uniref:Uncharacterized protein n=1 Tax=Xenorhabdus griffiniae TaxID=351672 RepID=A0ABY9XMJ7_9GAMM|nr:hypothetical protein [Xenorhabdus griffiniae]WMV74041.1 hypothetical protein QL128_08625 [Xenorhabdus griffiniae]WNH03721.1 hypothetical protein QL112_008630 [Xenorhabdus griffiniae]
MVQITLNDIKPMIGELGFTLPDTVLQLLLEQVNAKSECLSANYDESTQTQKLLLIYATVRLASLSGARKIASQGSPSGGSRSFNYDSAGTDYLLKQIRAWDKHNCLSDLPLESKSVGFFDVVG